MKKHSRELLVSSDYPAGNAVAESTRYSRASVRMAVGQARFEADVEITPTALLAIGGMVAAILVGVVPIVVAATRKLPNR